MTSGSQVGFLSNCRRVEHDENQISAVVLVSLVCEVDAEAVTVIPKCKFPESLTR